MTGTGTKNDPFIVNNWADFVSIDNVNEIYVKWEDIEDKVIDFNEIKPEGFTQTINLPRYTDFNGWLLKNFHANHNEYAFHATSNTVYVKNLIFENFYLLGVQRLFYSVNLESCIISGILNSNSTCEAVSFGNVVGCSFNVKAVTTQNFAFFWGSGNYIKNSDIILDASAKINYILNGKQCKANNSRFSGKIRSSEDAVYLMGGFGNVYNLDTNAPLYYIGDGISVYNSDFSTVASSGSANLKPCTSSELKSPEFLYNLGFPIGID